MGKAFEEQTKTINDQGEKQIKVIQNQGEAKKIYILILIKIAHGFQNKKKYLINLQIKGLKK